MVNCIFKFKLIHTPRFYTTKFRQSVKRDSINKYKQLIYTNICAPHLNEYFYIYKHKRRNMRL